MLTSLPAEPVRRGAVPLADDAESTLSAHDFVEKRKNVPAASFLVRRLPG